MQINSDGAEGYMRTEKEELFEIANLERTVKQFAEAVKIM